MKRKKHINPFVALLVAILLYLLASTLEPQNIKEDQQANRLPDKRY